MCGIYGWQFKPGATTPVHRGVLAALLSLGNDNRGGESWGYWDGGKVQKGLKTIIGQSSTLALGDTLMAHTRKATTGKVVAENSHPYQVGHILGAHNGMVFNHDEMLKKYERKFEVDSMHLFAHLSEGRDFGEMEGYGAIEYADARRPGAIFLCKMKGGDLAIYGIGKSAERVRGVVWSSSETHLRQALEASGLPHFNYKVEEAHQYEVRNGALFVTDLPKLKLSGRTYSGSTDQWGHWNGGSSYGGSQWAGGRSGGSNTVVTGRNAKAEDDVAGGSVNVVRMSEALERRISEGKMPTAEQYAAWGIDMRHALNLALDSASMDLEDEDGSCVMMLQRSLSGASREAAAN